MTSGSESPSAAWVTYCERLAGLASLIEGSEFALSNDDAAEGVRYLARMTAFSLIRASDFSDPDYPLFMRRSDDSWRSAGPNVDNVVLAAPIAPGRQYRVSGHTAKNANAIFQIWGEPSKADPVAVRWSASLEELTVFPDGGFEMVIGGDPSPSNWIAMPGDAVQLIVREYVPGGASAKRSEFAIERMDAGAAGRPRLTSAGLAGILDSSLTWMDANIPFWIQQTSTRVRDIGWNRVKSPVNQDQGAPYIRYGPGLFDLTDEECLLVELPSAAVPYWSVQLYNLGWYESLDFINHKTCLNSHQAFVDSDGCVRVVLSRRDPGVPNWLDTDGHQRGMLLYRTIWAQEASGEDPTTRVVPRDSLRDHLPADHPQVDASQREAELRRQRLEVQHRYRR